jgi:hypothetical protein
MGKSSVLRRVALIAHGRGGIVSLIGPRSGESRYRSDALPGGTPPGRAQALWLVLAGSSTNGYATLYKPSVCDRLG